MTNKDMALMKASALAGYVLSVKENNAYNQSDWNKRGVEIAEALLDSISKVYSEPPTMQLYAADQVKS